jgi:hypothetical protein
LENLRALEDEPTMVATVGYLLALDDMCNQQGLQVKSLIAHTEVAEACWLKARVELGKAEARIANAESRVIALEEKLIEQADHHSKLLRGMFLVERAKRKELHLQNAKPPILEGIPLYHLSNPQKRICEPVPPTPPISPHDEGSNRKESFGDHAEPVEEDR